jgi:hypothetical protein
VFQYRELRSRFGPRRKQDSDRKLAKMAKFVIRTFIIIIIIIIIDVFGARNVLLSHFV